MQKMIMYRYVNGPRIAEINSEVTGNTHVLSNSGTNVSFAVMEQWTNTMPVSRTQRAENPERV